MTDDPQPSHTTHARDAGQPIRPDFVEGTVDYTGPLSDSSAPPTTDPAGYTDPDERWNSRAGAEDPNHETTSTLSLFDGDEGWLPLTQRRALVSLMKNRFISTQTHAKDYKALAANPGPIRARLHDMFLELHLDTEREVAFKRPVSTEASGASFPTLLHDSSWGREDTVVLVFLRTRFRNEQAAGADRVFIDREDIHEYVAQYRPGHATNVVGDTGRVDKAIETIYQTGLLIGSKTGDRFQISNAIEPLLPHETLLGLLTWLRGENTADPSARPDELPDDLVGASTGLEGDS